MDRPVTITFVPQQIVTWLIIGLIAGMLASLIVHGRYGVFRSIVLGLLGALLGGLLFSVLPIQVSPALQGGITLRWSDMLVSFVGALIILLLFGLLPRFRRV